MTNKHGGTWKRAIYFKRLSETAENRNLNLLKHQGVWIGAELCIPTYSKWIGNTGGAKTVQILN